MADFIQLPVDTGEGQYHFNRFRTAFLKQPGKSKEHYGRDFVSQFPRYFTSQYAKVERVAERNYDGKPVLKFHGFDELLGFDLAAPHHDWVVQFGLNPNRGFTVQTLERTFREPEDAAMAAMGAAGGALGGAGVGVLVGGALGAAVGGAIGAIAGGGPAYNANFRHFLAGRRAWRVDDASVFGVDGDFIVLETAAVERFSCEFYRLTDKAHSLQKMVPPIWNTMLTNFTTLQRLTIAPPATPVGWTRGGSSLTTDFITQSFDGLEALKKNREFHLAIEVYPYLLPDSL